MSKKPLKLSVVIPAYNEQDNIPACLDALIAQSYPAFEIVVVDNNSTDSTVKCVEKYKDVILLHEPVRGQQHAQVTGFNAAKGDVIVRIDVDTIVPENYLKTIANIMGDNTIGAVTGYGKSRFEFIPGLSKPLSAQYFLYTHAYFGYPMLWGANMAFRSKYWHLAQPYLLREQSGVKLFHEDQDLSLALVCVGCQIVVNKRLTVSVQMQDIQTLSRYRKYLTMMYLLKYADKLHPRHKLSSKLPQTPKLRRLGMWLISVWAVYFFYVITIAYSTKLWLNHRFGDV